MKKIKINYKTERAIRAKVVLWLLEKGAPIHKVLNKKRMPWNLNSRDLLQYPKGSLGNSLGEFYKKENFEPVPKAERHDVFHVLLGYSTDVIDEAAMQFFLWGNRKPSFFTVGSCIITAFFFPGKLPHFISEFQRGKQANSIREWNFQLLLNEDVQFLRNRVFTKK